MKASQNLAIGELMPFNSTRRDSCSVDRHQALVQAFDLSQLVVNVPKLSWESTAHRIHSIAWVPQAATMCLRTTCYLYARRRDH